MNVPENPQSGAAHSYWRKCTTCKNQILFGAKYWICSVSTCNRQRTGLVFCDIRCFDAHVPVLNHRDAGAFEKKAPTQAEASKIAQGDLNSRANNHSASPEDEILVVVSKVKAYIRAKSEMNTSDSVMDVLSDFVRAKSDHAMASAGNSGRKTVLERDLG